MVKTLTWISSDVEDEWVYIIPVNQNEDSGYKMRRGSILGMTLEVETVNNAEAVKLSVAMRNFVMNSEGEPVKQEGYVKSRDLDQSQKRKLSSVADDFGVEPYVVIAHNPAVSPVEHAEASTISEARSKASEVKRNNNQVGEVYDLVGVQ